MVKVSVIVNNYRQMQGINSVVDQFFYNRKQFEQNEILIHRVYDFRRIYKKIPHREQPVESKGKEKLKMGSWYNSFWGQFLVVLYRLIFTGYKTYCVLVKNADNENVYLFQDVYAAWFYLKKRKRKEKIIIMTHMFNDELDQLFIYYPKLKGTAMEQFLRKIYKEVFCKSDMVITICDIAKKMLENRGIDGHHIKVLYNSVPKILVSTKPGGHEKVNFVMASSITKRKGCDLLVEALAMLDNKKKSECTFHIYGTGDYFYEFKKTCRQKKLSNVFLYGQKQKPYFEYRDMDVFLLTSRNETLPMGILEAMSVGLPIVSTDVGAVKELVRNKENGILTKTDAKSIKRGIEYMIDHKSSLKEWGDMSRKLFEKKFSPRIWTNNFTDIIKEVYR